MTKNFRYIDGNSTHVMISEDGTRDQLQSRHAALEVMEKVKEIAAKLVGRVPITVKLIGWDKVKVGGFKPTHYRVVARNFGIPI